MHCTTFHLTALHCTALVYIAKNWTTLLFDKPAVARAVPHTAWLLFNYLSDGDFYCHITIHDDNQDGDNHYHHHHQDDNVDHQLHLYSQEHLLLKVSVRQLGTSTILCGSRKL